MPWWQRPKSTSHLQVVITHHKQAPFITQPPTCNYNVVYQGGGSMFIYLFLHLLRPPMTLQRTANARRSLDFNGVGGDEKSANSFGRNNARLSIICKHLSGSCKFPLVKLTPLFTKYWLVGRALPWKYFHPRIFSANISCRKFRVLGDFYI